MENFKIANLIVRMEPQGKYLYDRSRAYKTEDSEKPDIVLTFPENYFEEKKKLVPHLTLDECRYIWAGEAFYRQLLLHDGLLMHASCIERGGSAYLFSAKSGTGKSTHTHLWMDVFGDCTMINDDKPAIRKMDGTFYACGTPFSGKNDESTPKNVPIRAIVFVKRDTENHIEAIPPKEAIPLFLDQTLRPPFKNLMTVMLDRLSQILTEIPVFILHCNMDPEAAKVAYAGIDAHCRSIEKERNKG